MPPGEFEVKREGDAQPRQEVLNTARSLFFRPPSAAMPGAPAARGARRGQSVPVRPE